MEGDDLNLRSKVFVFNAETAQVSIFTPISIITGIIRRLEMVGEFSFEDIDGSFTAEGSSHSQD
jgi:hypothetical protein